MLVLIPGYWVLSTSHQTLVSLGAENKYPVMVLGMVDEKSDWANSTPDDSADKPDKPSNVRIPDCLVGCLGLFLFYILSMVTLVKFGGWVWLHVFGLTILFFFVLALSRKLIRALIPTATLGIIAILFNVFFDINKPLRFDHITPQKNDLKVMQEVFRTPELPSSFKIISVRWNGENWFPSQGLRTSEYAVDVNASDLELLLSNVSGFMKPAEHDLFDFYFVMDSGLRDSLMIAEDERGTKHRWKQFEIEIKDKLETIRWSSALGWDELTSPTLHLYIRVVPEFR